MNNYSWSWPHLKKLKICVLPSSILMEQLRQRTILRILFFTATASLERSGYPGCQPDIGFICPEDHTEPKGQAKSFRLLLQRMVEKEFCGCGRIVFTRTTTGHHPVDRNQSLRMAQE